MGWVRLSDDFYDHRKFADIGPLGLALWVTGLAWCNRNLSDGVIPRARARNLLDLEDIGVVSAYGSDYYENADIDDVIDRLVNAGLWEISTGGGYLIHDYHDYQPSADDIQTKRLELSTKRSEAGRLGGLQNRRSSEANKQNGSKHRSKTEAKPKPQPQSPMLKEASKLCNSRGAVDNSAAAAVFEEALGILADRRVEKRRPDDPSAYRSKTLQALRTQYADHQIKSTLAREASVSPVEVANALEPIPRPPRTDFASGSGILQDWTKRTNDA